MSDPRHLVYFGPNGNCTLELCDIQHSVYRYRPSLAANAAFIALFSVAMAVHIVLCLRWKTWWFLVGMILGCISEIIGYAGRVMMWYNPFKFTAFMIQIVCVTSAPVYFTAAIYITLAQTVNNLSLETARFAPHLFYWIFIISDLISLVFQAVGGAMSTTSNGASQTAINIALAGLTLQVFTLAIFAGLFVDYILRFAKTPMAKTALTPRVKTFLGALALATLLILARCGYRVAELREGYGGPLVADEPLFIGMEGVLVIIAVFVMCYANPGYVFKKAGRKDSLSAVESTERHGHGHQEVQEVK